MNARTWLVFVALGIVWGIPYLFIKLAVRELSPFDVAWGRITLAVLILLPIAWQRRALRPLRAHLMAVCAFGLLEFAIPYSLLALCERWIPSSVAGILIAAVPLTMVPISHLFGVHEPLGSRRLGGLLLGLAGVATLVGFGAVSGWSGWAGVGCMLIVTICYATGPLVVQRYLHEVDSVGSLAGSLLFASALLLIPAALTLPGHLPSRLALGSIAVLGVLCTGLSMIAMFYLIKRAGAARTSVVTYINPAVAALLGVFVLHEHLGISGVSGLALILLSCWLATHGAHAPRTPAIEPG